MLTARPTVTVGTPATVSYGSDSYPYEVIGVSPSGATLTLREMSAKVVKGSAHDGSAEWECTSDPNGRVQTATWRRGRRPGYILAGHSNRGGGRVSVGRARMYRDPSF